MVGGFQALIRDIRKCRICEIALAHEPRPVFNIHEDSRVIIIGQAPGKKVHESGVPWDDPSGNTLRKWLGIDATDFYDERKFAIMPMGFCYPGKGTSGDLPPRPECAPQWHPSILAGLNNAHFTLLIGQYAQNHYLGNRRGKNLTETVHQWHQYLPGYFPLPHPSPRNRFWMGKNPWFAKEVLPELRQRIAMILGEPKPCTRWMYPQEKRRPL